MKAYQLRAGAKSISPSAWKRILVPAGMTFSQLSIVLNTIFGLASEGDFEFEFCRSQININASDTMIDDYFETEPLVTYRYGDQVVFQLEVEEVKKSSSYAYPMIVSSKGFGSDMTRLSNEEKAINQQLKEKYFIKIADCAAQLSKRIFSHQSPIREKAEDLHENTYSETYLDMEREFVSALEEFRNEVKENYSKLNDDKG